MKKKRIAHKYNFKKLKKKKSDAGALSEKQNIFRLKNFAFVDVLASPPSSLLSILQKWMFLRVEPHSIVLPS